MDKFVYVGKPFRCCEGRYGAAFRFGRVFGEFFFAVYSRGQRAKRACLHAYLATAALGFSAIFAHKKHLAEYYP